LDSRRAAEAKRSAAYSQLKSLKPILLLISVLLIAQPLVAQRHFYLEERFKNQVKIPSDVLGLMRQEIERKRMCRIDDQTNISSWFSASRIDLGAGETALILASDQMCLNGADNNWFWVFLRRQNHYRMVLTGGTLSVDVLRSTNSGLHNIETNVATANTNYTNVYKFNGQAYRARICLEMALFPDNQKPKRVSCRSQ
jgi:hypothetical protein